MDDNAYGLLRQLERHHVAPRGEVLVDLERAASLGAAAPGPVLLLTDAALYASRGRHWERLALDKVQRITVSTDPSGMLTRYRVLDTSGQAWFDVAVPMARASFRARMEELQSRRDGTQTARAVRAASLASLATAQTMASAASMVSASSVRPMGDARIGPRARWSAA